MTTREKTADHAVLARLRQHIENLKLRPGYHVQFGTPSVSQIGNYWNMDLAADIEAILSEIAALKGEVEKTERDYSELRDSYDAVVAKLGVERTHGTAEAKRATQAERQRDELRKALEPFAAQRINGEQNSSEIVPNGYSSAEKWRENVLRARQALANQGADQ